MTSNYEWFLAKLRQTPRDWYLDHGSICRPSGLPYAPTHSPLTALVPDAYPGNEWGAARELGLDDALTNAIVDASERVETINRGMRRDLLAACGLSEVTRSLAR